MFTTRYFWVSEIVNNENSSMLVLHWESMATEWTRMEARGAVIDPMTGDPAVLLEDPRQTSIIVIPADPAAAGAIISELEGIQTDSAHTLLYRFFVRHSIKMLRLELSSTADSSIVANIHYLFRGEDCVMDVRPVDGLLIAVQTHAPVFAAPELVHSSSCRSLLRVRDARDVLILSPAEDLR
jgi:bifunctional DNase/RNase